MHVLYTYIYTYYTYVCVCVYIYIYIITAFVNTPIKKIYRAILLIVNSIY